MAGRDMSAASPDTTDAATLARFLGASTGMISKFVAAGIAGRPKSFST
jgi:hypothetical protein